MGRILLLVIAIVGTFPAAAKADDQVDAAVQGLRSSNVYVAPGTPGTTADTAVDLKQALRPGDSVVLVMLPDTTQSAAQVADQIDQATNHKYIIGVSVGDEVRGESDLLPDGQAADLMQRANSVATSPEETLVTFTQLTHSWQAQHPSEVKTPVSSDPGSSFPLVFVIIAVSLVGIVGGFFARRRLSHDDVDRVVIRRSPDNVKDLLEQLQQFKVGIHDEQLRRLIDDICRDTEEFFLRTRPDKGHDTRSESATFVKQLEPLRDTLKRYVDIQNNGRYYNGDPVKLMRLGFDAVEAFSGFVLESVRRENASALTNFKVDSQILDATRYR